jgi:arabinofuranan 3-O-arabinosyltransferase
MLGSLVQRPEDIPAYWHDAAEHLETPDSSAPGTGTRVLEIPGSDFAAYRWGNSGDPVLPGLIDRPHVARELIPQGSPASAALLVALDTEIQEGRLDADALAPLARLMGVGDVVLRSDLQFERFRTPRPVDLWEGVRDAPGFDRLIEFGSPLPNVAGPQRPLLDQHTLSRPASAEDPAPVVVLPVTDPVPILRTADPSRPILVSGDAEGIVAAAGEGLLEAGRPLFLTGSFSHDAVRVLDLVGPGTRIVLTDSNRKDGHRWGTIRETAGYTERVDEQAMGLDLSDHALTVIDDLPGVQTVAIQYALRVDASGYGNPVTFTPGDRPFHAVDGDSDTAWTVGAFNHVVGERLILTLDDPVPVAHLVLEQARLRGQNRWITQLAVGLDEQSPLLVDLDETSHTAPGQVVVLPDRGVVSRITLEIRATDVGQLDHYAGVTGVGFAEVRVSTPGSESGDSAGFDYVAADETIALPTDLSDAVRSAGLTDPGSEVAVLLTRQRSDPRDPIRTEPEQSMDRTFVVPWDRPFLLHGEARLSAHAPDDLFNAVLGDPSSGTASATGSLAGDLTSRARAAFDDDPLTAWQTPIGPQEGHALTLALANPQTFVDLVLAYRADGLHSAPRTVTVVGDDGPVGTVDLPGTLLNRTEGVIRVPLDLPAFTSRTLTIRIDEVVERRTMNWYSGLPDVLPVGIVEVNDGVTAAGAPDLLDTGCRSDLVTLDGRSVSVRISGTTVDARTRQPLIVEACDSPLILAAGSHRLRISPGKGSGFDLDRLVLIAPSVHDPASDRQTGPELQVTAESRTSMDIVARGEIRSFWLVLGQSYSDGWRLTLDGATVDGADSGIAPVLVDGFANGWLVTQAQGAGEPIGLHLRWTPQRLVRLSLGLSLFAAAGCLLVAWRGRRDIGVRSFEPSRLLPAHRPRAKPVGLVTATCTAAVVGGFALVNLPGGWAWSWVAPGIAFASWTGLRGMLPQRTSALAGVLAMGTATVWIAANQIRFRFPRDFVWPLFFEHVHVLGVIAVLLLAAAAAEALIERRDHQD